MSRAFPSRWFAAIETALATAMFLWLVGLMVATIAWVAVNEFLPAPSVL